MRFPKNFLFGTANADHQVEAYDPKYEDVWDLWEKHQGLTPRGKGTDFWNRYQEDIENAANLGCKLFRFSISWARVEPKHGYFDPVAIAHYQALADCVRDHGMQLMVTLHHFVWPAWLERDFGGMIGAEFPDLFARYAQNISIALAGKVDWWITFNEPSQLTFGYIKPWWQSRYYMPPGLPRGNQVDAEAEAIGKLVPNLFTAHARARKKIKALEPEAKVGVNPLVTGFPNWLQMLLDWAACHRKLAEASFKFTTQSALFSEKAKADLVIAGISDTADMPFEKSDPYLTIQKALLVPKASKAKSAADLTTKTIGFIEGTNFSTYKSKHLPFLHQSVLCKNYHEARDMLQQGKLDAVYGDDALLLQTSDPQNFRLIPFSDSKEHYVVISPQGHHRVIAHTNSAIAELLAEQSEKFKSKASNQTPIRTKSLHEVFTGNDSLGKELSNLRGLRRILRKKKLRVALREDASELEKQLAEKIAFSIFGNTKQLKIRTVSAKDRYRPVTNKGRWLNWAWRFWGTTSLIANVNWWYLGMSGKLARELCPTEAVGAQDFIGLDYYWGLPTHRLHRFKRLEDAAHGRFLKAPIWPRGLYHALRRFHRWFPEQELLIVENGCTPSADDGVSRTEYIQRHIQEVSNALAKGVPVRAYNYWSITSNREWGHAFDPNTDFGLYFIDLDRDPELKRKPTAEAELYKNIIQQANETL